MRTILAILALAVALAFPATAAKRKKPDAKPFQSVEELLKWVNGYRHAPEPNRLPEAVKAMSRFAVTRDMDQAGIYIGFTAGVLGANPDTAGNLVEAMFPLPSEDQVLVIKGIAYSGLPQWRQLMTAFVERMPARKVLIDLFLFGNKPLLADLPISEDSSVIDLNWGYYFATGAEEPVRRIVNALALSTDKNDVEKLTLGAMAKWTLAQNASRDGDLLLILKRSAGDVDPKAVAPLGEVILAAETLELGKLRKEALASIEELKTKGPENVRNFNWWGQAGQTVLALGCITASVMGQVQFGIPCVVGGAASSAALKYLGPSQ